MIVEKKTRRQEIKYMIGTRSSSYLSSFVELVHMRLKLMTLYSRPVNFIKLNDKV